jgi:hypothetical protein
MVVSLANLKRIAARVGCTVENDRQRDAYCAEAKPGFVFCSTGTHEVVAAYYEGGATLTAEARAALLGDIEDGVEPCETPGCEWCSDNGIKIGTR